jgi:Protein of unknown function, DUF481
MNLPPQSGFVFKVLRSGLLAGLVSSGMMAAAQDKPAKPEPDVIVFKNGDQMTGVLEKGTGNSIVFKSDMAGEITVSLDNVKELRAHGTFAVLKKDTPVTHDTVHPGVIAYTDGAVTVENPAGVSSSVPEKDLAFIVDQPTFDKQMLKPGFLSGWKGMATASASDVQATNYGTTFNVGLNLVRAIPVVPYLPPRNRTIFNVLETYGKLTSPTVPQTDPPTPNAVAKTSIFHADGERDEYFTPRFYALGDVSFDHNFGQGLNLQQVYGGGFGWTPIQQPIQQLDLKVDVHYEKQQFQTPVSNQNLIGSTFAESYRRTLPGKLQLTETGSVLPAWNDPQAYSATGAVNLALPTWKRLTVDVGASDNFLNLPAIGFQKNSFQFLTGIGYVFSH